MMKERKTVLVTGGSGGIGQAIVSAFGREGYNVAINYYTNPKGAADASQFVTGGGKFGLYQCDVGDMAQVLEMKQKIEKELGEVDVLVCNSGIEYFGLFHLAKEDEVNRLYQTNLFGAVNCSRAFLPPMINKKSGCILMNASICGEMGFSCEVDYSVTKAGLIGLTKALSREVAPSGIRVNCISPGFISTPMTAHFSEEALDSIIEEIPIGRIGTPEDISEAFLYLASDKAKYITGTVLSVNGGWY
jgi:3-oxoacyl-[acyl-carrier protein] reductase